MIDIASLAAQVKRNCNISDAKFWGYYSLCGILLRLRDLYRIETGMRLHEKIQHAGVGAWITERESLWRRLESDDYGDISINGQLFSPFCVESINDMLADDGLIYGAGFGLHMKPFFFLADIQSKRTVDGFSCYITGSEYARDLSDYPAMLQDRTIIARTEMIRLLLWQRFEEMRCNIKESLRFAFSKYGIYPEEPPSEDLLNRIQAVAKAEAETFLYHELGEAFEGMRIGDNWKRLIAMLSDGKSGLFARGVKDILADTSETGMLKHIISNRMEGSLGFYVVFLNGFRKVIFPEILSAFQAFTRTGNWSIIDDVRDAGYRKAIAYETRLLDLFYGARDDAALVKSVENEILKDLLP